MEPEREPLLSGTQPTAARSWRKPSPRRIIVGLTLAFALVSITVLAARQLGTSTEQRRIRSLESEIEALRREWGVRGVSVAVVRRNEVLMARGFGERNEKGEPVTADTLFGIGSCTKAFTSLLVGQLVEQGKLSWTTPVTTLHPASFKDPIAASEATLIDILSHQTGLARHDALYGFWNTTDDWLSRVRHLEPFASFRSTYQYNNFMYLLAGDIVRNVTGKASWAEALRAGILAPLNMTNTIGTHQEMPGSPDHARSFDAKGNLMPYEMDGPLGPSSSEGAISTSANDVTQWLRALLGRGTLSGTQLVNDATFEQLTRPHKTIEGPRTKDLGYSSYALGWGVVTYRGHHSVTHTGGLLGFTTYLRIFPDDDLAYIVMSSTGLGGVGELPGILSEVIAERLLFPEIPQTSKRSDAAREEQRKGEERARRAEEERKSSRLNGTSPSHPLNDYEGTYTHPAYGRIKITRPTATSPNLHARVLNSGSKIAFDLVHWHLDVFAPVVDASVNPLAAATVGNFAFEMDPATGAVRACMVPLDPAVVPGERFVRDA
ncbi:beta-lactamase/transpeptidase-like protein [Blyttiomyces helicus]|uniref:Beta-lactamase/transpeptidase-like protein n=1 Tax=Blyttiomyces helicus TaxID=388810 RepID=A0A4P9W6D6_9FUNG|nr:beta-lactamase/transpeptidase-like protein [Blyttiomyces helicus]|eukprot:RKO88019.1 beta-lactamase/transpeptidase-like protein [Blyttiomyces helicus]